MKKVGKLYYLFRVEPREELFFEASPRFDPIFEWMLSLCEYSSNSSLSSIPDIIKYESRFSFEFYCFMYMFRSLLDRS